MAEKKKPTDNTAEIPADAETPKAASEEPKAVDKEVEAVKAKPKASRKPAAAKAKAGEDKPAAKKPAAKKPAAKKPAAAKPAAEKTEDKPATKKAAARKPAAKKAGEKPETTAEETAAPASEKPAEKPAPRARRGAEKPAAKARPAARKGRAAQPAVVVRAHAKYVRSSARKARLVCDAIRGKDVQQARAILAFHPRAVAEAWEKLLASAVANAENNHDLDGDDLRIHAVFADEGPTIKRFRPRAMGRATRIRKRTSHLTIQLAPKETR